MVDSVSMSVVIPAVAIPVVAGVLYFLLPGVSESPWTPIRLLGAILAIVGYVLVCVARIQLGKAFTVQPKATVLVTHGLYARLRNPIYVFVDVLLVGFLLIVNAPWLLPLVAVLIAAQTLQARREARVLQSVFGQAYDDYRSRTWF